MGIGGHSGGNAVGWASSLPGRWRGLGIPASSPDAKPAAWRARKTQHIAAPCLRMLVGGLRGRVPWNQPRWKPREDRQRQATQNSSEQVPPCGVLRSPNTGRARARSVYNVKYDRVGDRCWLCEGGGPRPRPKHSTLPGYRAV